MKNSIKILISILFIAIAVFIILNNNKNEKKQKEYYKIFDELGNHNTIKYIHDKLFKKINLFTSSDELASNYAYICIILYAVTVLLSIILISRTNNLWYVKAVDIGLMMILPYTIIKSIINTKYEKVKRQIPEAIEEFQHWFFRTKKIDDALKETSQHLKGNIAKPFQVSYYNIAKGESAAIKTLKDIFNDEHMDTFCQLLLSYIENGGKPQSLNIALTNLITETNLDISFTQKQKGRLLKYKIGAVILAIFTIIIDKYLKVVFTLDTPISNMNNTKVNGLLIFFAIYYFFIDILEHA